MPTRKISTAAKPWETHLFWGFFSCFCFAVGIIFSVVATMIQDIRFMLWIAYPFLAVSVTGLVLWIFRLTWARLCLSVIAWLALGYGTVWLFGYVPKEEPMPMEKTHRVRSFGLHEQFTVGACTGGVPELSRQIQWTWFLYGARFGCTSNEYKSEGTLDFEAGVNEEADSHVDNPSAGTVWVRIGWYSPANGGKTKWVLSTACTPTSPLTSPTFKDVLTIVDSPGLSHGSFQLDRCDWPDPLYFKLGRRGADKEDTLRATAHVQSLFLDGQKDLP